MGGISQFCTYGFQPLVNSNLTLFRHRRDAFKFEITLIFVKDSQSNRIFFHFTLHPRLRSYISVMSYGPWSLGKFARDGPHFPILTLEDCHRKNF